MSRFQKRNFLQAIHSSSPHNRLFQNTKCRGSI
ncbi:BnaA03g59710D [Brassica napus]|uniref:BnaA03g59710D protein n=1 Tax=Brassica napus TaxID=3708 RepID=A0A078GI40_BRANA|nr:BnaA03g59710D [Brassica napus]